jgi:hypothetical protein
MTDPQQPGAAGEGAPNSTPEDASTQETPAPAGSSVPAAPQSPTSWAPASPPPPAPQGPSWGSPPPATPPQGPTAWAQPPQGSPGASQPSPPAPPTGWVQPGPQGPAPGWGGTQAVAPQPPVAPSVLIAGIILLLFGLLTLLVGVIVMIAGSAVGQFTSAFTSAGFPDLGNAVATVVIGIGAVIAVYGGLEVVGAFGVFARRGWGRALGIATSTLGVLFGLLAVLGATGARATDRGGGGIVVALVLLAAYGFTLLALALGGHAFHRSG